MANKRQPKSQAFVRSFAYTFYGVLASDPKHIWKLGVVRDRKTGKAKVTVFGTDRYFTAAEARGVRVTTQNQVLDALTDQVIAHRLKRGSVTNIPVEHMVVDGRQQVKFEALHVWIVKFGTRSLSFTGYYKTLADQVADIPRILSEVYGCSLDDAQVIVEHTRSKKS